MTIYVDPLFRTVPSRQWPYKQACHLTCSGDMDELHAFAHKLGLKRVWFQNQHSNPLLWHYDLTATKRLQALRLGASAITREQVVERVGRSKAPESYRLDGIDAGCCLHHEPALPTKGATL
jgi:Protein of unknown function (DUF4031)